MPIITRDQVTIEAQVRGIYNVAYAEAQGQALVNAIATTVETTLPVQTYDWWGQLPTLREWVDERTFRPLSKYRYTISDRVWESTIAIERRALEDDQASLLRARVQDLAQSVVSEVDRQCVEMLLAAFTTVGPDGQYIIDSDHPESGSLQSNLVTGALNAANLRTAMTMMMSFKGDAGRPLGRTPTHLLVGPANQWTALELIESPVVVATSGTNYANVLRGTLQVLVTPYIPGNQWFVLDCSRALRPLVYQVRSDVPDEIIMHMDPRSSALTFLQDIIAVGVRKRYGLGYGHWATIVGSQG